MKVNVFKSMEYMLTDLIRKTNLLVCLSARNLSALKICLSFVCLLFLLTACSDDRKTYLIGVSQCSEDVWRDKLNGEIRDATYIHDNIRVEFASADDSDKKQTEQINAFVERGVDLLIVSPNQMNTVTPAIDRAYGRGIPVILFDRKSGSDKYTAFIAADNEKIGYTMGEYIAGRLGGKGTVAEITGLEGSSPAIERHKGFVRALGKYPGIRLLASRSGTWVQQSGDDVAERMFASGLRPDYIFAHNDRMALGAWHAARRFGLGRQVRFVGVDAMPGPDGGIRLVRDGVLEASYIYPTRGDVVVRLALDILQGKPYKRDNYMKAAIVTGDNAETMLLQAEEIQHVSRQLEELHGRVDTFLARYSHQKVYFILCILILLLVVAVLAVLYRMVVAKRRMEQEAAEAKLSFFTDMSHDLRTPLTLIADPVERILDDDNLTGRQRSMLAIVRRNAALLLRLVSEILDLRKLQSGKMELTVSRFSLTDKIRLWTDDFIPVAESKGVTLAVEPEGDIEICADYYKVERICHNLISNAIKYNRKGGSVTVKAAVQGAEAVISVADTGVGMPEDSVTHVFDKFFRVKDFGGGTGVGLAVVKAFAVLHGGSVTVSSIEGKGSEFVVRLPLEQPGHAVAGIPEEPEPRHAMPPVPETADGGKSELDVITSPDEQEARPVVLVVDDNDEVRRYVASVLGGGYDVRQASDGREGLDMALKTVPDLIVCDVLMPVMDGLEMCRRVKNSTATSHIPVVLLTSNAYENQRAEGYDCGADGYITKPFSSKVLLSRVRNLLENRKRLKFIYGSSDSREESAPTDSDGRFMADFRRAVQEHLSDSSLNVETVSAALGLSRVQLYRKVKSLTGSSPVEIIRITRLKRAERLLKTTDMTVSEISYEVGFSSPSYFSKCFKDYFGTVPGDMRDNT